MDDIQKMKLKLNAIYGKQIYNLSKTEKEYLINDVKSTLVAYMSNRGCGKRFQATRGLFRNLIKETTHSTIEESKTRELARTAILFSQLNWRGEMMKVSLNILQKRFNSRRGQSYEKNRFPKTCDRFTSSHCVDGTCPIALAEENPWCHIDAPSSCKTCSHHNGTCDECIFENTIYCFKGR